MSHATAGLNIDLPHIRLAKTTGQEELGAAGYTRGRTIFLSQQGASRALDAPDIAFFLLAHELFHVLSREDSKLRDDLYALLGFTRFRGFEYPAEFEGRRLSNPDSFKYQHTVTVQTDTQSVDVVPIIQERVPLEEAITLPSVFDKLGIDLLAIDTSTGAVIRDGNGDVVKYDAFDNRKTNYITLMSRNTDFFIQPEEVLADNFALLMQWRADDSLPAGTPSGFPVNDVDLLVSLEDRLAGHCDDARGSDKQGQFGRHVPAGWTR